MPRFSAHLSMLFPEHPFLERFALAREAGFEAVEYWYPYTYPAEQLAEALHRHRLRQALINLPPGDIEAGDQGLAALPGREDEFREAFELALSYARVLDCPCLHAMAGNRPPGPFDMKAALRTYVSNLRYAAERAAAEGRIVVIEAINTRDMPDYFLTHTSEATFLIQTVDHPGLGLLLDLYHCQIMGGDLAARIHELVSITRHVQIAGVPDRHEPDVGEVHYPYLFGLLDSLGYQGFVGCEYHPRGDTRAGFAWLDRARGR